MFFSKVILLSLSTLIYMLAPCQKQHSFLVVPFPFIPPSFSLTHSSPTRRKHGSLWFVTLLFSSLHSHHSSPCGRQKEINRGWTDIIVNGCPLSWNTHTRAHARAERMSDQTRAGDWAGNEGTQMHCHTCTHAHILTHMLPPQHSPACCQHGLFPRHRESHDRPAVCLHVRVCMCVLEGVSGHQGAPPWGLNSCFRVREHCPAGGLEDLNKHTHTRSQSPQDRISVAVVKQNESVYSKGNMVCVSHCPAS